MRKLLLISVLVNLVLLAGVLYLSLWNPQVATVSTSAGMTEAVRSRGLLKELARRHGEEVLADLVGRAMIDLAARESKLTLDPQEFEQRWKLWVQEPGVKVRMDSGETTEAEFKDRLRTLVLLDQITEHKYNPKELDKAILDFYDAFQPELEEVRLRHILVENEEDALDVEQRLNAGVDFPSLAKRFSLDPLTREQGGDLGWKSRADLTDDLHQLVFVLPVGVASRPVASKHGWHIFLVEERRSTFAECRQKARLKWLESLRPATLDELRQRFQVEKLGGEELLRALVLPGSPE